HRIVAPACPSHPHGIALTLSMYATSVVALACGAHPYDTGKAFTIHATVEVTSAMYPSTTKAERLTPYPNHRPFALNSGEGRTDIGVAGFARHAYPIRTRSTYSSTTGSVFALHSWHIIVSRLTNQWICHDIPPYCCYGASIEPQNH